MDHGLLCERCHERPGTEIWSPGGSFAYIHGAYQMWCKRCVLEAQLAYAREMAAQIPALEQQLAAVGVK